MCAHAIGEFVDSRTTTLAAHVDGNLTLFGPVPLAVRIGRQKVSMSWYVWTRGRGDDRNSALVLRASGRNGPYPKVRVHSACQTGDVFASQRCDCGAQLREALQRIASNGVGCLLYLGAQEGRGIGLFHKAMAYAVQQQYDLDTVDANEALSCPVDGRSYAEAGLVLRHLIEEPVILMTNNPSKARGLKQAGVNILALEPLWAPPTAENRLYLETKVRRLGHLPGGQVVVSPDPTSHP